MKITTSQKHPSSNDLVRNLIAWMELDDFGVSELRFINIFDMQLLHRYLLVF